MGIWPVDVGVESRFPNIDSAMSAEQPKTNPMLATELLGYHPQLLLDELMSSVNETIYECVARVEDFLNNWIDEKRKAGEDVEHLNKEVDHVSPALFLVKMARF